MRNLLTLATIGIVLGMGSAAPNNASAAPVQVTDNLGTPQLVEKVTLRRYSRYPHPDVALAPDPDQMLPPDPGVVVAPRGAVVAVRPASCGEFHYWDGTRCIDKRYEEPHF
jgi:hypothetical protein